MSNTETNAGDAFTTRFSTPQIIPAELYAHPISANVSNDGKAVTVLFQENITAVLPANGASSVSSIAVLTIPIELPDPPTESYLGYYIRVDGFVDITEGTCASLIVNSGTSTKVKEFEYGKPIVQNFVENIFSFVSSGPRSASSNLTLTFILTAQRLSATDEGQVRVDSVSVEINGIQKLPVSSDDEQSKRPV